LQLSKEVVSLSIDLMKRFKKLMIMTNLLSTLSQELQTKLADFKVSMVFIECGESITFHEILGIEL